MAAYPLPADGPPRCRIDRATPVVMRQFSEFMPCPIAEWRNSKVLSKRNLPTRYTKFAYRAERAASKNRNRGFNSAISVGRKTACILFNMKIICAIARFPQVRI